MPILAIFSFFWLFCQPANLVMAQERALVIDPGHGGRDQGGKSVDGITEKIVTLGFSRILAKQLAAHYAVQLTRTDDYTMDNRDRTAVANHVRADAFISIHAAESFSRQARGIRIFYYDPRPSLPPDSDQPLPELADAEPARPVWGRIQEQYARLSQDLGQSLLQRFKSQNDIAVQDLQGEVLEVLEGADMPSVMIELGYLSHPAEAKLLGDEKHLLLLANLIGKGIDDFFAHSPPPAK